MSEKTEVNIFYSKNPFIVTVHKTSFPTISIKLDGANYRVWSQIMNMHIAGRRKKGYITGRKVAPAENNPSYNEWEAKDALVKTWLINSMTDKLMAHFVQCGMAKGVSDAIKRSYLDVSNSSQVYELKKKSFQSRQGGRYLSENYSELNSIFLELDYRRPNDMDYTNDIEKLRKRIVEDRIYIFLAGLDHNLDQVSDRILATSPLPSLEEAYSQVRREEQRQFTMGIEDQSEAPALTVQNILPTIFLVSTLAIIAQDIPKMFVGRTMAIRSGSNSSKLKRRIKNLQMLLSQILLHLLLLMLLEYLLKKVILVCFSFLLPLTLRLLI